MVVVVYTYRGIEERKDKEERGTRKDTRKRIAVEREEGGKKKSSRSRRG